MYDPSCGTCQNPTATVRFEVDYNGSTPFFNWHLWVFPTYLCSLTLPPRKEILQDFYLATLVESCSIDSVFVQGINSFAKTKIWLYIVAFWCWFLGTCSCKLLELVLYEIYSISSTPPRVLFLWALPSQAMLPQVLLSWALLPGTLLLSPLLPEILPP